MFKLNIKRSIALVSALVLMTTPVLAAKSDVNSDNTYVDENGNIVQIIGNINDNPDETSETSEATDETSETSADSDESSNEFNSDGESLENIDPEDMDTLDAINVYSSRMNESQKAAINELIQQRSSEGEVSDEAKRDYKPTLVLGADLSDAERSKVLEILGLKVSDLDNINVSEIYHQEEVDKLTGIIPAEQIGNKSVSSVLINPLSPGSGISIGMVNIAYITNEMLYNILATAGAEDIEVKIVAPYKVSGSAALLGIIKSYSNMTGIDLGDDVIGLTLIQSSLLARLSAKYGEEPISKLFSKARIKVLESGTDNTKFITEVVRTMAEICKVPLEDSEVDELTNMLASMVQMYNSRNKTIESKYIEVKDFKSELDYETSVVGVKALNWLFNDEIETPVKETKDNTDENAFEGVETNTSNIPKEAPKEETEAAVETVEGEEVTEGETSESTEETNESTEETSESTEETLENGENEGSSNGESGENTEETEKANS